MIHEPELARDPAAPISAPQLRLLRTCIAKKNIPAPSVARILAPRNLANFDKLKLSEYARVLTKVLQWQEEGIVAEIIGWTCPYCNITREVEFGSIVICASPQCANPQRVTIAGVADLFPQPQPHPENLVEVLSSLAASMREMAAMITDAPDATARPAAVELFQTLQNELRALSQASDVPRLRTRIAEAMAHARRQLGN